MDPVEVNYGSDKHGLVWAYRFAPGAPAEELGSEQVAAWLEGTSTGADRGFVWLHLSLANTAAERWLRRAVALPESFYETLAAQGGSTRLEQDDDTLVAVLHDALFDFTFDPEAVSTVNLCLTPRVMISARLRPVRSLDQLRRTVRSGRVFGSAAELLAELLRHQADVMVAIVRRASETVDGIEDKLLAHRVAASRRELGELRRTLVRLQRLLAPEPAALFRLLGRPPAWIAPDDVQELRQAAEEFSAAIADSGVLVERVKLLQEELAALVGEETNRTLFVLTVVTVLALPVNIVAGLFGMNVGGVPLSAHRHGFLVITFVLSLFTLVAAYLTLWRRRD